MKTVTGKFAVWALAGAGAVLSGCGHIANFYDRQDPCQDRPELRRPPGYRTPTWCGASQGRIQIYDQRNQPIGYIK